MPTSHRFALTTAASIVLAAAGSAALGQVELYTDGSRIDNPDGEAAFEAINSNGIDLNNWEEGGMVFDVNNISFVFCACGFPPCTEFYYPNAGSFERIVITRADEGPFANLEFDLSHGWSGCTVWLWVTAYLDGQVVGDFDLDAVAGEMVGLAGEFDEVRIGGYSDAASRDQHAEGGYNAAALDNARFGTGGPGAYRLRLGGSCPGTVTLDWNGAPPNSQQGIVFASNTGNVVIPNGPCAGTQLGLGAQNLQLVNTIGTGPNGSGLTQGLAGIGACGGFLQLVSPANPTCATSNVDQLP